MPITPTKRTTEQKLEAAIEPHLLYERHRMALLREVTAYGAELETLQITLKRELAVFWRGPGKNDKKDRLSFGARLWIMLGTSVSEFQERWRVRIEPALEKGHLALRDSDDFFVRPGWLVWTDDGIDSVLINLYRNPLRYALIERQAGTNEIMEWVPLLVESAGSKHPAAPSRSVKKPPFEMAPRGRYTVTRDFKHEDPIIVRYWANRDWVTTGRLVAEMYPGLARALGFDAGSDRLPRQTSPRGQPFDFDKWNGTRAERKTWTDITSSIKKRWKKLEAVLGPFAEPQRREKRPRKSP